MRFVSEKSIKQQDMQSIHRIRSQLVARQIVQGNQIRGLLLEYGIIVLKGISYIRKKIPLILEAADNEDAGKLKVKKIFVFQPKKRASM